MVKQKFLWIVLGLLLVLSVPGLVERWNVETSNDTYELVIPFQDIQSLTTDESMTIDDSLSTLKEAGLTTVSLEPQSLLDLESSNIFSLFKRDELVDFLRFQEDGLDTLKQGYYLTVPANEAYEQMIRDFYEPEEVMISDVPMLFLPDDVDVRADFTYDTYAIKEIQKHDLHMTVNVKNNSDDAVNEHILQQLTEMKDDTITTLLLPETEVIGYPSSHKEYARDLSDLGYNFYLVEHSPPLGLKDVASVANYEMIRLHVVDEGNVQLALDESVDRSVRAVKERNIRSLMYPFIDVGTPEEKLLNAEAYLTNTIDKMPGLYEWGVPEPFASMEDTKWVRVVLLLAGVVFTYIAAQYIFKNNLLSMVATGFMAVIAMAYFLMDVLILLQGFALAIAVVTPIFAIVHTGKASRNLKAILGNYLRALGISLVGIVIVTGLLSSNAFIIGIEMFRGVKLVYIVPILFVVCFVLWNYMKDAPKETVLRLLNQPLKIWHVVILVVLGVVGLYYIARTGNNVYVSEYELMIRQGLEDALFVRPRTKEFLIGFPFYILALYVLKDHKLFGSLLLIPGVIGFLSIVNTFSHYHVPLYISVIRTFYSIIIGLIIGLILIYIYKKINPYILRAIQKR